MTTGTKRRAITRSGDADETGFAKVFAFLRDCLLDGTIRSGDRLIPERDLAVQLGVSRPLVREALRALSMMGVVEIRSRVGTVVCQPDVSVLGDLFAFSLAQQKDVIEDVMQARIGIECQAIRLACHRATTFDFERLGQALQQIEATIDDPIKGSLADFEFHAALVRASKSDTLASLYTAMASLLMRSHRDRRALVEVDASIKQHLMADHRRIFEAIAARNEDDADRVLRNHFRIGDNHRHQAAVEPLRINAPGAERVARTT
jgi:DNA-binding FadR family transcriptional regulator